MLLQNECECEFEMRNRGRHDSLLGSFCEGGKGEQSLALLGRKFLVTGAVLDKVIISDA